MAGRRRGASGGAGPSVCSRAFERLRRASRHSVSPQLIGWSVLVGVCGGVVVSAFRWVLQWSLVWLRVVYEFAGDGHWWVLAVIVVLSAVLAVALAFLVRSTPVIAGSGIPDVEQRLRSTKPIELPWLTVLWKKFVGGVLAIAPGLFLGREGPSIQMGALTGVGVSQLTPTTKRFRRELVAAGAAAGLSAAFNAPIAAVLFVAEEVFGRFSMAVGLSSFAAALGANAVSLWVFGLEPVFSFPRVMTPPLGDYGRLVILGMLLGGVAWLYSTSLLAVPRLFDRLRLAPVARMFVAFLLVIPVGMTMPEALGGGNGLVSLVGTGRYAVGALAVLLAVRFVLSQISYGSGVPGGIFLPILTLGALCGGLWGQTGVALNLWPHDASGFALMVIAGMAGLFGAVSKAPITAIILVMEMTSYSALMPLGVVVLIAYLVYDVLGGKAIYDALGSASHAGDTR